MKTAIIFSIGLLAFVRVGSAQLVEVPVVSGQVQFVDGQPVVGASLILFDVANLTAGPVAYANTDDAGYFALSLRRGGRAVPQGFLLGQNYPNPFNPSTIIPYQLSEPTHVRLQVFNMLGQHIATLVDGERPAGAHTAAWNATDATGYAVGAGVYIYRLSGGGAMLSRRMVLIDGQAGVPTLGTASSDLMVRRAEGGGDGRVYGLVVSGQDIVSYADPAFRVAANMSPVNLVVEALAERPSMKTVASERLGDVNNDGRIDIADALFVVMYNIDSSVTPPNNGNISLGDVNADGQIDLADVQFILLYIADPSDPSLPQGFGVSSGSELVEALGVQYTPEAFLNSASNGNLLVVETFFDANMDINVRDNDANTALIQAASNGHLGVVGFLVANAADVNSKNNDGTTALIGAASNGHLGVVGFLVANGADVDAIDNIGTTALLWAASNGHLEIVRSLVANGANVNSKNNDGTTALEIASREGHLEIMRILVEGGVDANTRYSTGSTALLWAASEGHWEIVRLLVENGAEVNSKNNDGTTALELAAREGHLEIMRILVEGGVDANTRYSTGSTALLWAASNGHCRNSAPVGRKRSRGQ